MVLQLQIRLHCNDIACRTICIPRFAITAIVGQTAMVPMCESEYLAKLKVCLSGINPEKCVGRSLDPNVQSLVHLYQKTASADKGHPVDKIKPTKVELFPCYRGRPFMYLMKPDWNTPRMLLRDA